MKISTSRFGEIEVNPHDIIEFPDGILGFEDYHRYLVLNAQENSPFRWLQCIDDGNLAFIVIEPLNFLFEYDLEISDDDTAFLGLTKPEEVLLYVIVTIPEDPRRMTANLQGPLVINVANRKARQVISTNVNHPLRASIVDEMARREARIQEVKKSLDKPANPAKEDRG